MTVLKMLLVIVNQEKNKTSAYCVAFRFDLFKKKPKYKDNVLFKDMTGHEGACRQSWDRIQKQCDMLP